MPQLNPAPWFTILITTWAILALVMKLTLTNIHQPNQPCHTHVLTMAPHWPWLWQ
uniref:ATP synthase complex subunit 8 n=1 Tax=Cyrtodactylus auribalteatus TaxID=2002801 RepID=A0A3G9DSI1_9SAUR|nr:ATP synthase F0 subunit 8 [Cyrtodactylus auribalteatus]